MLSKNATLTRILIFFVAASVFFVAFYSSHSNKGAFHTDEPGIVLSAISGVKSRSIYKIFADAAYQAQPPLEYIIREKLYTPIGYQQWNWQAFKYPEFFHRFLSFLWWLLPIGYFSLRFSDYSKKRKLAVIIGLSFIITSELFRYYLAETKHYSAIGAVTAAILLVLFIDKVSLYKRRYEFLAISSLLPLLHLISYPYYLVLLGGFFTHLFKTASKKKRGGLVYLAVAGIVFQAFVIAMYFKIKEISGDWQHPSLENIRSLNRISYYIKWTLDWTFYQTPLYPLYSVIPKIVKNNFVYIFGLVSIPIILASVKKIIKEKSEKFPIEYYLYSMIFVVWPLTTIAVSYRSGMFRGERYSISVLTALFLLISLYISEILLKIKNLNLRRFLILGVFASLISSFYLGSVRNIDFSLATAEDIFIRQNPKLIADSANYILADNGVYSQSLSLHALIDGTPFKASLVECRHGTFIKNGENALPDWLKEKQKDRVYIFGPKRDFMEETNIIWQEGGRFLYLLNDIDESQLCNEPFNYYACFLSCFKGSRLSVDERSVPDIAPHLDVYRE